MMILFRFFFLIGFRMVINSVCVPSFSAFVMTPCFGNDDARAHSAI